MNMDYYTTIPLLSIYSLFIIVECLKCFMSVRTGNHRTFRTDNHHIISDRLTENSLSHAIPDMIDANNIVLRSNRYKCSFLKLLIPITGAL